MRPVKNETGSALLLVPAGLLILFLFASLAIDSATIFYAQRELNDAATSLANQIATSAVDLDAFYGSDGKVLSIDDAKMTALIDRAQHQWPKSYLSNVTLQPTVSGAQVTISATGTAHNVVLTHLPTGNDRHIKAVAQVSLLRH